MTLAHHLDDQAAQLADELAAEDAAITAEIARQDQERLALILARVDDLARQEARANAVCDDDRADRLAELSGRYWRRFGTPIAGTFGGCDAAAQAYGDEVERFHAEYLAGAHRTSAA